MPEIIVELNKNTTAEMPLPGMYDVKIEDVRLQYNNVGDEIIYVEFSTKYHGKVFRWALTYKRGDAKLNKLFPDGAIVTSDVGSTKRMELIYCDSKNGVYPSPCNLDW